MGFCPLRSGQRAALVRPTRRFPLRMLALAPDSARKWRRSKAHTNATMTAADGRPDMPRFAANLAYLFTERPFLERFGAAAAAGFTAVELQFPYDQAPSGVKAELARHGLTMLGINTPPGKTQAGEFGLAALP